MPASNIITRFAPSPTGFLHIGGARTALFNWAFARHHEGQFLLRIEDTDRARSTSEAIDAILGGLEWLGLDHDGDAIYQHHCAVRHVAIAQTLLAQNAAYRCYCTPDEVEAMRQAARKAGQPVRYDGRCRTRTHHPDKSYVIRFAAPLGGSTIIDDLIQGRVQIDNNQFDDLVLLRSDGTPTYMLSVIVDDHDMGVTHIIRGDDHLTNAVRQAQIYAVLNWQCPIFAHVPLIHGADGKKLSKRDGALGIDAYRDMGVLASAMRNYLARLGWSHGDDEIFTTEQLVGWFNLEALGKSPARFDMDKLWHVNTQHIRMCAPDVLIDEIIARIPDAAMARPRLRRILPTLINKVNNLNKLTDFIRFIFLETPIEHTFEAQKILAASHALDALTRVLEDIADAEWTAPHIEQKLRAYIATHSLKLGDIALPLRIALTGRTISPGIFDTLAILDRKDALARLKHAIQKTAKLQKRD